jgi:hypothetical protein
MSPAASRRSYEGCLGSPGATGAEHQRRPLDIGVTQRLQRGLFQFEAVCFSLERGRKPRWWMVTSCAALVGICCAWHESCLVSGDSSRPMRSRSHTVRHHGMRNGNGRWLSSGVADRPLACGLAQTLHPENSQACT